MSIGRIELTGQNVPSYSLPLVQTKPRNYEAKYLERSVARGQYYAATNRLEKAVQNQYLKVESERIADVNKINNKGMNSPAPNIKYNRNKSYEYSAYYRQTFGKLVDRKA